MCNYMGTRISRVQLIKLMEIEKELGNLAAVQQLELFKDGFKYSNSLILRKCADNDFEAVSAHWEFIPPWIKNLDELKAARKQGIPWLNARSETLLTSKMFRNAALNRRCLVLATHFYEWRHFKPVTAKKDIAYPYAIELPASPYFFMAGIWQPFTDKTTGETFDSFAIVTTAANELMAQVHNKKQRMPTILPEALAYEWMMQDLSEERILQLASYQLPSAQINAYSIVKDFKIAEDPLQAFVYEELPELNRD